MTIFIISLILGIALIIIGAKFIHADGIAFLFVIIGILTLVFCIVHGIFCSVRGYYYTSVIQERNAIIETLKHARINNDEIERAAITSDILEFNKGLAQLKVNQKTFFIGYHIDPRVVNIKPIY